MQVRHCLRCHPVGGLLLFLAGVFVGWVFSAEEKFDVGRIDRMLSELRNMGKRNEKEGSRIG